MYKCCNCGSVFEEPDSMEICYEAEYGVASLFSTYHWGTVAICPDCGSEEMTEEFEWENEDEFEE